MKYKGKKVSEPNTVFVVIPRSNGEDFVFKATAVIDMDEFAKKFPPPQAPVRFLKGNVRESATNDPAYIAAMQEWSTAQVNWLYINSLSGTEGLEWETVDPNDHNTFQNWQKELQEAQFTVAEIARIMAGVHEACGLSQERIDEARERFLAGLLEALDKQFSPSIELPSTPSGDPASDGASSPKE